MPAKKPHREVWAVLEPGDSLRLETKTCLREMVAHERIEVMIAGVGRAEDVTHIRGRK